MTITHPHEWNRPHTLQITHVLPELQIACNATTNVVARFVLVHSLVSKYLTPQAVAGQVNNEEQMTS